ncbi:MAG TPA: fluoride efflux transporter CrcB [Chthoniobacterales bacterium]|jgi:CrcB protein|nr:fluoride efflux transporter CrcB [Chthoniobacterales bacterium]
MGLSILLVFVGGALGTMWRFWWSGLFAQRFGETFPFGTLVVNVVGSLIIGVSAGILMHIVKSGLATAFQQLLMIGICGGLTTFSSFSLQTYSLIADRRWVAALCNILFSTGLSLGFLAVGWQIAQAIHH